MKKILLLFQVLYLLSCSSPQREAGFEVKGTSQLRLENNTPDSISIGLNNWTSLPFENQVADTLLLPGQSLNLTIITQSRHYYNLAIDNQEFRLYAEPKGKNEIQVLGGQHEVLFSGEHKHINEFLAKRNTSSDWAPRAYWFQGGGSLAKLLTANDSITEIQQKELSIYPGLPSWYTEFEKTRLDYVNVESKLSSVRYRSRMLGMNDSVPEDFLERVIGTLPIERVDFTGVDIYMRFLEWYISYLPSPLPPKDVPQKKQRNALSKDRIILAEQHLSNLTIKDVFLARYFTDIIDRRRHMWNKEWLKHIDDPQLSALIRNQVLKKPILPPGADLPYFYLQDKDTTSYEPQDFRGKILLINFWATWCKPCYKEFEHENQLVQKFKNKPVEIVNICIESKPRKWKDVIDQYKLETLNLFAKDQWSENINSGFGTSTLPHSILVDWNGKVIQNKCPKPSQGVDKMIVKLLDKMKNELPNP